MVSDLEIMGVMLGSYSRNELERKRDERDIEVNLVHNGLQQNAIPIRANFTSLLNTNTIESSEIRTETGTLNNLNNCEITSQVTKKLKEFKMNLNSLILEAINFAITEQVLPSMQHTHGKQEKGFRTNVESMEFSLTRRP